MTIHIRYHEVLEEKVRLDISAGNEACYALHCLAYPGHHDLQHGWIAQMEKELPQDLYDGVVAFGRGPSDRWAGATYLIGTDPFLPFEQAIAWAKLLPPDELRRRVLEEQDASENMAPWEIDFREAIINDPAGWRDEACGLLEAFWPFFLPTWHQLEPAFVRKLAEIERLQQRGMRLSELLPEVSAFIAYDPMPSMIHLASILDARINPETIDSFRIIPTYFGIPHPWVDLTRDASIDVWVPGAMGPGGRALLHDLAKSLNALGDRRRLEIVSLLAASPRSARELGNTLALGSGTLSRHLQVLMDVGLVCRQGSGTAGPDARYEVDPRATALVADELARLFGNGAAHGLPPE